MYVVAWPTWDGYKWYAFRTCVLHNIRTCFAFFHQKHSSILCHPTPTMSLQMLRYVYCFNKSFFMLILYPKDPSAICTQPDDGVRRQTQGQLYICMVATHASHLREEDGVYTGRYQRGRGFTPLRLSPIPGVLFHA